MRINFYFCKYLVFYFLDLEILSSPRFKKGIMQIYFLGTGTSQGIPAAGYITNLQGVIGLFFTGLSLILLLTR